MLRTIGFTCATCVTASVKYLMEQEKQECIPEEKEKQVNLTC